MSFTKKNWVNKGETGYEDSKINATNLNDLEDRIETSINGTILFSSNGNNLGDITLNGNVDDFEIIEIFGHEMGGRMIYNKISKIGTFIDKKFIMTSIVFDGNDITFWSRSACYTIKSNKFIAEEGRSKYGGWNVNGSISIQSTNVVSINKVIGYK